MKKNMLAAVTAATLAGGLLPAVANAAQCSVNDVQVTAVGQYSSTSADASLTWMGVQQPISAAACAGGYAGNDMPKPQENLGYAGDGLLNGAPQQTPPNANLFPGGAFNNLYSYSDLDGDGQVNDPGWIMLGRTGEEGVGFTPEAIGGDTTIVLSSFFSVTLTGKGVGTWSFTPDATVAERASALLGKNYFDQFVLVFKLANEFVAYDFIAEQFGVTHPSADDPIFTFTGTFDLSNTLKGGLSHVSLWARDPGGSTTTSVPEPGTLALLGLATLGLAFVRRRTQG